jgi:hypothetical protein
MAASGGYDDWLAIDQAEVSREPKGKPREKFTSVDEMLDLLGAPGLTVPRPRMRSALIAILWDELGRYAATG